MNNRTTVGGDLVVANQPPLFPLAETMAMTAEVVEVALRHVAWGFDVPMFVLPGG